MVLGIAMPLYKTFRKYPEFEKWVRAHRHSGPSIASEINSLMEFCDDDPGMFLRGYVINLRNLRNLRHEIMGDIRESKTWIEYFQKKGRG